MRNDIINIYISKLGDAKHKFSKWMSIRIDEPNENILKFIDVLQNANIPYSYVSIRNYIIALRYFLLRARILEIPVYSVILTPIELKLDATSWKRIMTDRKDVFILYKLGLLTRAKWTKDKIKEVCQNISET
jgi:hypothetical protein